jgi:uncharacterized protein YbjT (DUF2867 family)
MGSNGLTDVAVIGAAGATGRPLVRALARRGARIRALVHRPDQAELVPDAHEVAVAELDDLGMLAEALRNVGVVYYIPPVFNAAEERYGANVIAAAGSAHVSRLVYHSVLHASTPAMPHHLRKSHVELALRESPLHWTIVQPAMYVQSVFNFFDRTLRELGPGFDIDRPFSPIDIEDLGEAVAIILTEPGHEFATYELAGADSLSFREMAAVFSRVLEEPVTVHPVKSDVLAARSTSWGFSVEAAREFKAMLDHYGAHGLIGNSNVLRMILKRAPISFADAVRRDLAKKSPL